MIHLNQSSSSSLLVAIPFTTTRRRKHMRNGFWRFQCCANDSTQSKFPFKFPLHFNHPHFNFQYIHLDAVKKSLNTLISKTHNFVNEVASPLVNKTGKTDANKDVDYEIDDIFVGEPSIQIEMPDGSLSLAAVVSIEQFSRMNGMTGQKMQKIFGALISKSVNSKARNLVEYCCFRFLSRDNSDLHPCLEEVAFQKLMFITMIAWENPHKPEGVASHDLAQETSLKTRLVGEDAFVRIAPAISGVADRSTVHNLYKALAGDKEGISFSTWSKYIFGLLKVHNGRKSYEIGELPLLPSEKILCIGSSRKQPVLKWENNMTWPGKLTLTDRALYFEPMGLSKNKDVMRLDISGEGAQVKRTTVGLLGSLLFDSAVLVSSGEHKSDSWVLEFIDLGSEMRRDIWHASISEIISCHKFIHEFGPEEGDRSVLHVYGAHKGKERAISSAICCISRLQSLQSIVKLIIDEPLKLVQFSYLRDAPYGDIVYQTLALKYWGGPLITKAMVANRGHSHKKGSSPKEVSSMKSHIYDIDGGVYLRQWMRSPSWDYNDSISFWRNAAIKEGVVLSKDLVVGGTSLVERAATPCRRRSQVVEKTQATIDAATLEGIPSNIDLFKELLLPIVIVGRNIEKLKRWEEPFMTVAFLAVTYTIIFRNLLSYVVPTTFVMVASGMLLLKGLKEQGRLGRAFGKVTIRDQPPSNTIQKLMALKNAMRDMENYLQNINVALLKIRTIILCGQPQITNEVALSLLASAAILFIVPFRYILACFIFDQFTRELEFRREMVLSFMKFLNDRWETVPATPVIVLPSEDEEKKSTKE